MTRRLPMVLFLAATCGCTPNVRADLATDLDRHKLAPVYPARADFGAGTVFRIERSADGSRYTRVLCRNLFADMTPVKTPTTLKSVVYADPTRFGDAVGVVYGLVNSSRQAEENLQIQKTRSIRISYLDAAIETLPPAATLGTGGTAHALDGRCVAALAKLKEEGRTEAIHVVDRALAVNRFRIELERPPGATLHVMEVLGVDSDWKSESRGPNAIDIEAPYYIGMHAVTIVDIEPAGSDARPDERIVKVAPATLPERFRAWQ